MYAILLQPSLRNKLMKFTNLLTLSLIIGVKSLAQDSSWRINSFNEVLSFSLPANFQSGQSAYVKGFAGQLNSNSYGFQYYDSILLPIKDEHMFQISLLGFISGRAADSSLKGYSALVIDTSIGGTKGLMGKFTTSESSKIYKQIYYYVTMANNRYCWFYAYASSTKGNIEEINFFFKSIKFDSEKLKEKQFKLTPVYLKKDHL
jgi:hypothetical protein